MYEAAAEEETANVEIMTNKSRLDLTEVEVGTLQSFSASECKSTMRGSEVSDNEQQMLFFD